MPDMGEVVTVTKAEELNSIGAQLFGLGQTEPARLHFLAALALEPNNVRALQNLGACLRQLMHYEAAESVAKRSVKLSNGRNPFCRSNLGVSQLALKKFDEALVTLSGVVDDMPDSAPSYHNYGLALYMSGRLNEALVVFDKALALSDLNPHCRSDRALTLLGLGKIQEGLAFYEVRWLLLWNSKVWKTSVPEWKGEDLRNRKILVHHEQGFGDSIMLVRFVKQLEALGADITLAVPDELVILFHRSFPQLTIISNDDPVVEEAAGFDYHSPLLSVMRWVGIERPSDIESRPYLFASDTTITSSINAKIKIGICWASGNHGIGLAERRRVVPVISFLPLTEISDVVLISLQKGGASQDLLTNGLEGIIYNPGHRLKNFADTADLIADLDLVISVDSAVAHLAGALGKPCIMLSPYTRCWRWWDKTSGMPWYENMLQFHQSKDGTWEIAVAEIVKEVQNRYML